MLLDNRRRELYQEGDRWVCPDDGGRANWGGLEAAQRDTLGTAGWRSSPGLGALSEASEEGSSPVPAASWGLHLCF